MAKNWAIAIGINKYVNLQDLQFAKQDAELMRDFFVKAGFDHDGIFLFTDDSPQIKAQPTSISTQPTYGTVRRFLRAQFEKPLLETGDNLWFFFAGHGRQHEGRDYLMFSDSDPGDIEHTAIPVSYITERLQRWEADNVVLFIDACRDDGSRGGLGIGEDVQQGVVTFYACSPREKSYEIERLRHGAFTYVLHEALQLQGVGNCATVERLSNYLRYRVPQVNQQYGKNSQIPYAKIEPETKLHLILRTEFATLNDIKALKFAAAEAENEDNFVLAEQLWIRVLAVSPADPHAIRAIKRIAATNQLPNVQKQQEPSRPQIGISNVNTISNGRSSSQVVPERRVNEQSEANDERSRISLRRVPWGFLVFAFSGYAFIGFYLTSLPIWALALAWAWAWAMAAFVAENEPSAAWAFVVVLAVAVAVVLAVAIVGAMTGVGAVAGVGAWAVAVAIAVTLVWTLVWALLDAALMGLSPFFRNFQKFLIFAGTFWAGLVMGWLVRFVFVR